MNKQSNYIQGRFDSQFSRREQDTTSQLIAVSTSLTKRMVDLNQKIVEYVSNRNTSPVVTQAWQFDLTAIQNEVALVQRCLDTLTTNRELRNSIVNVIASQPYQQDGQGANSGRRNRRNNKNRRDAFFGGQQGSQQNTQQSNDASQGQRGSENTQTSGQSYSRADRSNVDQQSGTRNPSSNAPTLTGQQAGQQGNSSSYENRPSAA